MIIHLLFLKKTYSYIWLRPFSDVRRQFRWESQSKDPHFPPSQLSFSLITSNFTCRIRSRREQTGHFRIGEVASSNCRACIARSKRRLCNKRSTHTNLPFRFFEVFSVYIPSPRWFISECLPFRSPRSLWPKIPKQRQLPPLQLWKKCLSSSSDSKLKPLFSAMSSATLSGA